MRRTPAPWMLVPLAAVTTLAIGLAAAGFAVTGFAADDPAEEARAAVRRAVVTYVEAQNAMATNTVLSMWSDRPGVSSVGQGDRLRGYEAVRTGIEGRRTAPHTAELSLGSVDVELLGTNTALAVAPFKTAAPKGSGGAPIEGMLTLVFEKSNGKWKLVHEHASAKAYLIDG